MPLVRISLKADRRADERRAVADAVHLALVESIGVPMADRFQVISTRGDDLIYDPNYLGIARGDGIALIQISLSLGRTVDRKKALFRRIAERLATDVGMRPQDVFVSLIETPRENWSFGDGIAQYADQPPPHLR